MASEASEVSERQQKKVISPEHVIEALETLGFHEYIHEVKQVHREYKEQAIVSQKLNILYCTVCSLLSKYTNNILRFISSYI